MTGEPGGVYVRVENVLAGATPKEYVKWRPAKHAKTCISKGDLIKEVRGSPGNLRNYRVSLIGPDGGGDCMVYSTIRCDQGSEMVLDNPKRVPLLYPK